MCACASSRTWREENPERRRLQTKRQSLRYSKTHRGRAAAVAGTANYRAKKYGCVGRLTLQNVLDLWAYYGDICLDCKAPDTRELDHVKPLSLGGANFPANLQNVCHDCNLARWQSYVS
jgi:5-methylcytosine-specific restriction endonuclease McrA